MLVACPPVCCLVLWAFPRSTSGEVDARGLRFTVSDLVHMVRVWVVILVASFAISLSVPLMNTMGSPSAVALGARVASVVFFVATAVWACDARSELEFSTLWRVVYLTLCAAYAAVQIEAIGRFGKDLLFVAWDIAVPLVWVTLADIARHADAPRPALLGLVGGAYLIVSSLGGSLSGLGVQLFGEEQVAAIMAFVVALPLGLCLTRNSVMTSRIFEDMHAIPQANENRVLEARCEDLAERFDLTDRERRIVTMIAAGKTRAFIAEALVISENTVKSHASHAYAKLGVHSKKELYALVNDGLVTDGD